MIEDNGDPFNPASRAYHPEGDLDAFCLRCDRWYVGGERCPGCDGDPESRYLPHGPDQLCDATDCPVCAPERAADSGFFDFLRAHGLHRPGYTCGAMDCPLCCHLDSEGGGY